MTILLGFRFETLAEPLGLQSGLLNKNCRLVQGLNFDTKIVPEKSTAKAQKMKVKILSSRHQTLCSHISTLTTNTTKKTAVFTRHGLAAFDGEA